MYNNIHGRENHLVQVRKGFPYTIPSKDDQPAPVQKKKVKARKVKRRKSNEEKESRKRGKTKAEKHMCFTVYKHHHFLLV